MATVVDLLRKWSVENPKDLTKEIVRKFSGKSLIYNDLSLLPGGELLRFSHPRNQEEFPIPSMKMFVFDQEGLG